MKTPGEFEIVELFPVKHGIALAGRLISGGPISNDNDVLQKNVSISFRYNEKEISKKIIRLDGRFGRASQDIVIEKGENIALLIERDHETEILQDVKLSAPLIGTIVAK